MNMTSKQIEMIEASLEEMIYKPHIRYGVIGFKVMLRNRFEEDNRYVHPTLRYENFLEEIKVHALSGKKSPPEDSVKAQQRLYTIQELIAKAIQAERLANGVGLADSIQLAELNLLILKLLKP